MKRLTPLFVLALTAASAAAQAPRETPPAPGTPKDFALAALRSFALPNGLQVTLVPFGRVRRSSITASTAARIESAGFSASWINDAVISIGPS